MDGRLPLSVTTTRPLPLQRAVSGSALYFAKPQIRPTLPSRLSSVRSVSQPANVIDLTADGSTNSAGSNRAPYLENHGKVVASPDVIHVDDDDDEEEEDGGRPAKRAKIMGDGFRADDEDRHLDVAHTIAAGEQLPSLPRPNVSSARTVLARRRRHGGEAAARKANGINPPPMATRLPPPKNAADFSPWTGHHPEDVLNEAVVKAGYCDKGPGANQTECNSAKPSIWPNLTAKNNTGLQMLSYLFTQVMEKRQALGKCSAPSTFKPPPRVTVTDTKREAWLRDLANPDVPLRKQSRTIPHGIRGKLLMDQCMSKEIPLQRAVWLAKCVGANELRAFKRKGLSGVAAASGEGKWVREWTVHVEQFLESVVASCGQQDWQLMMTYAVRLSTAFYAEKLLDADHYLDWVVSSFSEASLERLPVWIIMVQIYWKDIIGFLRRGRRLAESILERLHLIAEGLQDVNNLPKFRLQKLIAVLAVTSRGCLVIPATWEKYKYLLTPMSTPATSDVLQSTADHLARRNERLVGPLSKTPANTRSTHLQLYDMLDSIGLNFDLDQLAQRCMSMVPATVDLIAALLDWASSPYRHGIARMYLAARVLSTIRKQGRNTDAAILAYLGRPGNASAAQSDNVYKVVGELVRLDAYNVGPYLQWLISSGAMYSGSNMQRAAQGLLAAFPAGTLPGHLASLRQTLLGRLPNTIDARMSAAPFIEAFESLVAGQTSSDRNVLVRDAMLPVKVVVADHVRLYIRSPGRLHDIELAFFCVLRDFLEWTEDIAALAEVITSAIGTDNASLLASVTDTAVLHIEALAALGHLESITEAVIERYRVLRCHQPLDRTLILALTVLVHLVYRRGTIIDFLTNDLAVCEQQNTAAVCSPASDNLIGMHASSLDSDNDIDAVFASGNTMDDQLLQRVFMRVLQRASKPHTTDTQTTSKLSIWLNQLRIVGGSSFNHLVASYVQLALKGAGIGISPENAITGLVASDCLGLDTVMTGAMNDGGAHAASLAMHLLLSPNIASMGLSAVERYSYRAMQQQCRCQQAGTLIRLLIKGCGDPQFDTRDAAVTALLVQYTSTHMDVTREAFVEAVADASYPARAGGLARAVLDRGLPGDVGDELDLRAIVNMADPLSIRFCAGELWSSTTSGTGKAYGAHDLALSVLIDAVQNDAGVWPQLLGSAVEKQTKIALHAWAQNQLLFASTPVPVDEDSGVAVCKSTDRYLDVLDLTYSSVREEDDTAVLATLTDKLRDVERRLTSREEPSSSQAGEMDDIRPHLSMLLHVCTLHLHPPAIEAKGNRLARGNLLSVLCTLLVHPSVQMQPEMAEHIFDLASALSDSVPETTLSGIAHAAISCDPRVRAILGGSITSAHTWLALAAQGQAGDTAQQRALAKRFAQQGQSSSRPGVLGQSSVASPQQAQPQHRAWPPAGGNRAPVEVKTTPYPLRRWEIMPDPTPVMGENDTSLSLGLFGARKV